MSCEWRKDPNDVLDYAVDWGCWLEPGDSITASTWDVPTGITKDSDSFTGDLATIWLSGGTLGEDYELVNHIETLGGREAEAPRLVQIRPRLC